MGLAIVIAWANLSLDNWRLTEFASVIGPGHMTWADWDAHNFLRYEILRPILFVLSVVGLPVWLFRVTRKWIAVNSERLHARTHDLSVVSFATRWFAGR